MSKKKFGRNKDLLNDNETKIYVVIISVSIVAVMVALMLTLDIVWNNVETVYLALDDRNLESTVKFRELCNMIEECDWNEFGELGKHSGDRTVEYKLIP